MRKPSQIVTMSNDFDIKEHICSTFIVPGYVTAGLKPVVVGLERGGNHALAQTPVNN